MSFQKRALTVMTTGRSDGTDMVVLLLMNMKVSLVSERWKLSLMSEVLAQRMVIGAVNGGGAVTAVRGIFTGLTIASVVPTFCCAIK
jgi:hypothetical protein